ncbi:S10 family peptidase [Desertibaculum subflavum]|uniref:S10 family peptidase n=1 Tax=Desertibaculum subflavum TaxID=2268458 RepID=UPI0013C3F162
MAAYTKKGGLRFGAALWLALTLAGQPALAQAPLAPPAPIEKPGPIPAVQREAVTSRHTLTIGDKSLDYTAEIGTVIVTANDGERQGEMFYTAYRLAEAEPRDRPIAFVVNGGPGAASAYLHLGALGPKIVRFNDDGSIPPPPARLVANAETWLPFADLVFIDPIGTGFSRSLKPAEKEKPQAASEEDPRDDSFWGVEADKRALTEFIRLYLTRTHRWLSPVFLVGESYGGFRVAVLVESLPEDIGVAPAGAVLVSPVLEFSLLYGDAYRPMHWVTLLPSYAATAAAHGRQKAGGEAAAGAEDVEAFAVGSYLGLLVGPKPAPGAEESAQRRATWARLAELTGIDEETLRRHRGRLSRGLFAKALLRDQGRVLSAYDGTVTAPDPAPGRAEAWGPDPLLAALTAPLTSAFNAYVRDELNFKTELRYHLLNRDVSRRWAWRGGNRSQGYIGAADDLKTAMSVNPDLRLLIVHGRYDLVTPYFASTYVIDRMDLGPALADQLTLQVYDGGHMFYTHAKSRKLFRDHAEKLFADALAVRVRPPVPAPAK